MGCATGIVKFMMFLFNFIFVVGGILMVTLGVLVLIGYKDLKEYEPVVSAEAYKAPPILLIVVGTAVFLIAFMGCCGVLRESNCMMMTYAVFLGIILLVQIGIVVAALMYQEDFKGVLRKGLVESIDKYDVPEVAKTWDLMQTKLKCCGGKDYKDWAKKTEVPVSCCKEKSAGCSDNVLEDADKANKSIYTKGCVDKLLEDLMLKWVVIAAAAIGGVELLGVLLACCLAARFRRKSYA